MKILMINDYGYLAGGAETYLFTLKNYLERKGHEVAVLSSNSMSNKKQLSSTFECNSFNNSKIPPLFGQIFNINAYLNIRKIVKDFNPEIVHLHNIFYQISPSFLAALKNIPVVMTVHDYTITCPHAIRVNSNKEVCTKPFGKDCLKQNCLSFKGYYIEKFKRMVHRILLKNIDLFIAPSKFMGEILTINGFRPIMVLNNSIDSSLYNYENIEMTNIILSVGRIVKEKGLEYLLKAMPLVLKKIPDARLLIVGEGPEKDDLMRLSKKLKMDKYVKFLGRVPDTKLNKLYQKANVVVIPSIWPENSPIVIYECMAYGRPVIGSDNGGVPELIENGKTGFLVESRNSEEIAERIIPILSNEELARKMGRNAREKIEKEFNMEDHLEKILKLYWSMKNEEHIR